MDRVEKEVGGMEMAHEGMIWSLAWHPLGHILCSGSNDHTRYVCVCLCEIELINKYAHNSGPISALVI